MPEEYRTMKVQILCRDCHKVSDAGGIPDHEGPDPVSRLSQSK